MKQLVGRASALIIFSFTLFHLNTFPVAQMPLLIGYCIYVGLLLWRPSLWLLLLPALLPLLYLSPWSGRLFLDEFDALLACSLAVVLWKGRYAISIRSMRFSSQLLLLVFLVVYFVALLRGLLPLSTFNTNSTANYYSNLNSLRVAKGLLWALLLYPAWVFERRLSFPDAQKFLMTGMSLGAFVVLPVVLWERNVFFSLIDWSEDFSPIQALLDFSTEYRVTGLFADMHTGGTAIDGFLLLVLPFTAMVFISARSRVGIGLGSVVFFGLLYVGVVTFSRGVYLGIGVALLATIILVVRQHRYKLSSAVTALMALGFLGLIALAFVAFRSGGTIALLCMLMAFLLSAAYVQFRTRLDSRFLFGILLLVVAFLVLLSTWIISLKHYDFDAIPPVLLAIVSIVPSVAVGLYTAGKFRTFLSPKQAGLSLLTVTVLLAVLTPSLFGYRMVERFSTVQQDLLHRVEHWQTAVNIMNKDWPTELFGQGLGRFPVTYFWQHQLAKDVGGFTFQREKESQYLHFLGAHDVRLGQRISLQPDTSYVISADIRTGDDAALFYLRICHRQLIHPNEWNPNCIQFKETVKSTKGQWVNMEFPINSDSIGSWKNLLRAPLVLSISNRREYAFNLRPQTILDIDNVSIRDAYGVEYVVNGDFEAGIDRWFAYYDFNHLPWHIKNIWVHVYFETGLIGLVLFVLLVLNALYASAKAAGDNRLSFAIFVSLLGFLAVGSFGTLIDSPRIAFLFYLLLLIGLGFGRRHRYSRRNIQHDELRISVENKRYGFRSEMDATQPEHDRSSGQLQR